MREGSLLWPSKLAENWNWCFPTASEPRTPSCVAFWRSTSGGGPTPIKSDRTCPECSVIAPHFVHIVVDRSTSSRVPESGERRVLHVQLVGSARDLHGPQSNWRRNQDSTRTSASSARTAP